MCCWTVDSGIPSSADYLGIEMFGVLATDSSTHSHYFPPIDRLTAIVLSLMLPITKPSCSNRRSVCFGGAPWSNLAGNLHAPYSFLSLFLEVCRSRHLQQSVVQRGNRLCHSWFRSPNLNKKIYLRICEGKNTLWPYSTNLLILFSGTDVLI